MYPKAICQAPWVTGVQDMHVSLSLTFISHLVAIWVHRRHDVNACVADQLSNLRVGAIVPTQILYEVEHQLSTDHFIAVHVGHILKFWLTWESVTDKLIFSGRFNNVYYI